MDAKERHMNNGEKQDYVYTDIVGTVYVPDSSTETSSSPITDGVAEIFEADPNNQETEESEE